MVKYETVIGIIGNTQGVSSERAPIPIANQMNAISPELLQDLAGVLTQPRRVAANCRRCVGQLEWVA